MALSLRKNFGFSVIGNLFYAASQYIILLIFIKLYSIEDVGMFIFAGAFTSPVMLALDMQLRNFYITDQKNELALNDYFGFRTISNILGLIGLTLAAFFLKPEYLVVILIVSLIKVFESQLDLIYGVYQKKHHLDYVAYSRAVRGILAVFSVGLVSFIFRDLIYSLLAYLVSWFILYFLYERRQVVKRGFAKLNEFRFSVPNKRNLGLLLTLCIPMFFSILVDKYYLNYPRLKVESLFGVEMLGIFGSLLYFKSLGGQFISSVAHASMPKLSEFVFNKNKKSFNILVLKMVGVGFLIGFTLTGIIYLGGERLLVMIYTKEYAIYNDVLVLILIGTTITFSYVFITSAITAMRKQWVRFPISIISFTVLLVLFRFFSVDTLRDIAIIVILAEAVSFVIYYSTYIVFINRIFKT
ncbi:hypothetical protein ACFOUP_01095 [Belliella kenyensis]|uniref:Membrane protein involved in the export of O-antigen and teichoic acid n=1 Tax=Belliella kenyensis TaxID=1472724 RepID=A0ABV8EHE0_9BACT|nr:hypothetical protein [Belliella kenyensis]MCH7401707.1 hypothetical protein [Belliella kenyensis]MDN3604207.1 hypothetical protein [Belliella kenyensis]